MARVAVQNSHKALQLKNVSKAQPPTSESSTKHIRQTSKSGSGSDKMWQYLDEGIQFGKSSNMKSLPRPSISDTRSKTQTIQGASPQTAPHRPVQPGSSARPVTDPNRSIIDNRSTTTLEHNQLQKFRVKRQKIDEEAQHWSLIGEIKYMFKSSLLDRAERKAAADRRARREAARLAKMRAEKAIVPTPIYDQFRSQHSQYRQASPSQRAETASLQRPQMALTRSKKEATPGEWSVIRRKPVPMHELQQHGLEPKVRPGAQQSVTVIENPLNHKSVHGIRQVSVSPPLSKKQKVSSGGTTFSVNSHADFRQIRGTRIGDFMDPRTSSSPAPPLPVKNVRLSSPTKKTTGYQLSRCGVCGEYETHDHPLLLANDIWFCASCFNPRFSEEIPPPPPPKDDINLYQPAPLRPLYNTRLSSQSSIEGYMSERPESPLSMISRRSGGRGGRHESTTAAPSLLSQEIDHHHTTYHEDSGYSDNEAPVAMVDPRVSTWAPTDVTPLGPDDSVSVRNWGGRNNKHISSYYATPTSQRQKGKGVASLPPPVPLKGYKARVASSIYPEDEAPKQGTVVPDVPVIPTKFLDRGGAVAEDEGFLLKNTVYGQSSVPSFRQEDVDAEVWRSEWMEGEGEGEGEGESENDWDNRKSSFYGPIHDIVNEHSRQR
ncbi:MAG: hypothetical protein OHK93_002221 [Ramalina farinacea]|uniref:Uncharacterized protein n=1 Tax=Ramalina farinacea TaxID=258253 RepID=A0AA43QQX8_9LECA|nr:hypothetical protein [Ramalina farinacea]